MTLRYTTVLFDLDHTLFDSHASERAAFDATMKSIDVEPSPEVFDVYDALNQALWRKVEAGQLSPNDVKTRRFEQLLESLGVAGDPAAMGAEFVAGLTEHGELYPGALDVLKDLSGRAPLGLVTNGIGSVQRGRLDRLGIGHFFDTVAISGELGMSKPAPAIFDFAFEEMGIDVRTATVMVGDSLASDVAGAHAAGIASAWFNPHGSENETDIVPTHELAQLDELSTLVT